MESLFTLPEEYQALRESVRALADKKIQPFAHDVDANARFPQEAFDALQSAGLAAAHVPTQYGGEGADALGVVIIIEEVARVCASSSLIPAVNKLGSVPLMLGGNEEQKKRWLTPLAQGKGFSYCLSESEAGSDAAAMKTRAVRKGDGWVLNGSKKWISHAGFSDFYTVLASTDPEKGSKGITAFVVEKSDSGVSFGAHEKKMGFKGSPTREVYFDNVEIGDDRRISEVGAGFALAMKTLDHTRITIAAQALGIAQGAFEVATKYAHERKQFGKAIFDFQAVQFMLADMAMEIAKLTQIYEGTNQVQRLVMARNLNSVL